jgi:hypothetical protein
MTTVRLAVYDLSHGAARQFAPMLGLPIDYIPHTGVLCFGYEYFYGGGIQKMKHESVCAQFGLRPINTQLLGTTMKTEVEFVQFLSTIRLQFLPSQYDLFLNNCNHFSDLCTRFLLNGHGIPAEITSLPQVVMSSPLGGMIRPMLTNMQSQFGDERDAFVPSPSIADSAPPISPSLVPSLKQLDTLISNRQELAMALQTLHVVLRNVVQNPLDEKFRRIPLNNAKFNHTLGRFVPAGLNCLLGVGFFAQGDFLLLQASEDQWKKVVLSEKIVAAARKRLVLELIQATATKEEALNFMLHVGGGKEDAFVVMVVNEKFNV